MSNANQTGNGRDPGVPNWLLFLFFGIMVVGALYAVFMHGFLGYDQAFALRNSENRPMVVGVLSKPPRTPDEIAKGKALTSNCASCHGPDLKAGAGLAGPNLTDAEWLHGATSEKALVKLITEGISP